MKTDRTAWNASVSHPLQSWEWGEFRKTMGVDVTRIENWQLTFHTIPHTPWTIGYFPKGPIPDQKMIETLTTLGKEKHAIYIQLEPNVTTGSVSLPKSHHPMFTKHTFIINLTKSEKELLESMHSKTRYNIKIAQKHNVIVKEDNSPSAFAEYQRLSEETTKRQGFYAHNTTYHKKMWDTLSASGIAHLFTATYNGETLAAWIIFTWNTTMYYPYGASSRNHREVMAPQLLLWELTKWGKGHGYTAFDLWGALGDNPDPKDPWYGFHRFKEGFKPELVEFIGSFDLIIQPLLYQCFKILDSIRWFFLKLIK